MTLLKELPSRDNSRSAVEQCINALTVPAKDWNWIEQEPLCTTEQLDSALMLIRTINDDNLRLRLLLAIALYSNKHTPWSNAALSMRANSAPDHIVKPLLPQFIAYLQPRLLSASPKTTKGRNPRATRNKGLRPILGHATPTVELDKKRHAWKTSHDVSTLGLNFFWMRFDSLPESVSIMAAFALNVVDDSHPAFRTQGCHLIRTLIDCGHFQLLKSLGFMDIFKDEIQTSFNYLPRLTRGEVSLQLMKAAYPVLIKLVDEKMKHEETKILAGSYLPYLEILDSNVLGLVSHIQAHGEGASNLVLVYLLQFGKELVDTRIGAAILACYSQLNYIMCRLITDPYVIDSENGPLVIEAALDLQKTTLEKVLETQNGSCELILAYQYDFLAAWIVYFKRVLRCQVGTRRSHELLTINANLLKSLAEQNDSTRKTLQDAINAIQEQNPEARAFFD